MEERRANAAVFIAVVLLLLALPLLYVLSFGPVAAFYEHRDAPAAVEAFYTPLIWLADAWQPAEDLLNWYVDLWIEP
jgi:hypothetical protein